MALIDVRVVPSVNAMSVICWEQTRAKNAKAAGPTAIPVALVTHSRTRTATGLAARPTPIPNRVRIHPANAKTKTTLETFSIAPKMPWNRARSLGSGYRAAARSHTMKSSSCVTAADRT